jgi:hypothetical protein
MASAVEFLDQLEANIDTKTVLRIQGFTGDRELKAGIREITCQEVEVARELAKPRAIYREVEVVGVEEDAIGLEGDLRLHVGREIAGWWQGSQFLAIALCTIGGALEERILELSKNGEHTAALILDIAGSVALGSATDQVRRFICEKASNSGMKVGPGLNPGYAAWPLTDQRLIFSIMPAERIGVRLNDQLMMIPKKSASFCAGLGVSEALEQFNRCKHCGLSECPYRRTEEMK